MNPELELKQLMEEAKRKMLETGEVNAQLKAQIELLQKEVGEKFNMVEQRLSRPPQVENKETKSLGEIFIASPNWQNFKTNGMYTTGKVNVGSFKAITNATGASQPLVAADRQVGIYGPAQRQVRLRDVIPVYTTDSNSVEYTKENVFTNSAAVQGNGSSPLVFENVAKAESNITFTLGTAPVRTIAHWITVSNQVLSDSAALQSYINNRLMYGLTLAEEDQIINGTGSGADLTGLEVGGTAYDTGLTVSGDSKLDKLRHAIYQVENAEFPVDAILLNPKDWHDIELIKDSGTVTGNYVFGNPANAGVRNVWGIPVVVTNAVTSGTFHAGSYAMSCGLFDKMESTIEVSRSHSDYFVKNMTVILAEERMSLAIFRPAGICYGSF